MWRLLIGALGLSAASAGTVISYPDLTPLPAVAAYAASHGLALGGEVMASVPGPEQPGDTILALASFSDRGSVRQWLLRFTIARLTEKERLAASTADGGVTINGRTFKFHAGETEALEILTIGPFTADGPAEPAEKQARALAEPDFLKLGLYRACLALGRITQRPGGSTPSKPPTFSEEDTRALAGMFPALIGFLMEIEKTPGLSDLLWTVLEKPSLWTVALHGGKIDTSLNFGSDAGSLGDVALPFGRRPLGRLPVTVMLYNKPALECTLFVSPLRPLLVATAGTVGVMAYSPKDESRWLKIQLLSAKRGQ